MTFAQSLYNTFFRSNSIMLCTVFAGAFALQVGMDVSADRIWDHVNKGRQWKDIKAKYVNKDDDE